MALTPFRCCILLVASLFPALGVAQPAWTPRPQAQLHEDGGALLAISTGTDPGMVVGDLVLEPPVNIAIRYRGKAQGAGTLFFATTAAPNFAEARKVEAPLTHDGLWREANFRLEASETITRLRLDMATGPGEIAFDWIQAEGSNGPAIVWEFSGVAAGETPGPTPTPPPPLSPGELLGWSAIDHLVASRGDGYITLTSDQNDPKFSFTGDLPAGPFQVDLRLRLRRGTNGERSSFFLFFPGGQPFIEYEFSHLGTDWYEVTLQYTGDLQPNGLRFDPVRGSGSVDLEKIEVYREEPEGRTLLRSWNFAQESSAQELSLSNEHLRAAMDLARSGGAITWLSQAGSSRNLVNNHDRGRQIQQSYYTGLPVDRLSEGQHPAWSPWPWNPIQVGDAYGHSSEVLEARVQDGVAYVKTAPLLWDMNNEPAEATMEQWVRLEGNSVHVRCRFQSNRTDERWTESGRDQELPAVYLIADLNNLLAYTGDAPWTNGPLTRMENDFGAGGFPWARWQSPERWGAAVDDAGWGVGVYNPICTSFLGGYVTMDAGGGELDANTAYISPVSRENLKKTSTFEYEYWLIVGTTEEIRGFAQRQERGPASKQWMIN